MLVLILEWTAYRSGGLSAMLPAGSGDDPMKVKGQVCNLSFEAVRQVANLFCGGVATVVERASQCVDFADADGLGGPSY